MTKSNQALIRSALALGVLGVALAGCGGQQPSGDRTVVRSGLNQPRSYDPPGPPSDPWGPWIVEASRRYDVPERWIREVMRQESGGRMNATSPVGAMGLMQVMPGTYAELRARYGLGNDPYHPYDNLMAGTAYLREMYDLYGSPAFLAAYNAGPRRLEDYLFNSRGLPAETRNYVARIGPRIDGHHPSRRVDPVIAQAAEIPHNIPPGPRRMDRSMMAQLRDQRLAANPGVRPAAEPLNVVARMDPIPDGSTPEGAARLLGNRDPAPLPPPFAAAGTVVAMAPIPDGSTPEGAARLLGNAQAAEPPLEPLPLPLPVQYATAAAPERAAGRGSLAGVLGIGSAQAAAMPARPVAVSMAGGWSVQVGAFSSENLARNAATQAKDTVATIGSRVVISPVQQGRTTLYRARVTGLSQSAAQSACDRLRGKGGCSVVAPGA
jgi:cell division septation protein DedD